MVDCGDPDRPTDGILGVTALLDVSGLTDTLIDSIAIVIYVALIILGTRMKKKQYDGQQPQ